MKGKTDFNYVTVGVVTLLLYVIIILGVLNSVISPIQQTGDTFTLYKVPLAALFSGSTNIVLLVVLVGFLLGIFALFISRKWKVK